MKKQILILAAIGVISLSANAYAQSNDSASPSEPYVSGSEENTDNKSENLAKKRETTREANQNRKNKEEPVPEKPQNRTGHDD